MAAQIFRAWTPDLPNDPEAPKTRTAVQATGHARPMVVHNRSQHPDDRYISFMRPSLDRNAAFKRPPEVGDSFGNDSNFEPRGSIPLRRRSHVSGENTSIHTYEGDQRYKFEKGFVVKTIRQSKDAKNARANAQAMKDIRHPHCMVPLATFVFDDRLSLMMFPVARCNLHQLMEAISHELVTGSESDSKLGDTAWKADNVVVTSSSSDSDQMNNELPIRDSELFSFVESINILRRCFMCLSQGLAYLHASDIRHKNIKPENILVDGSGSVLLADYDYGISNTFPAPAHGTTGSVIPLETIGSPTISETSEDQKLQGRVSLSHDTNKKWHSTRRYSLPEKRKRTPRSGASDIFALGCVFLETATILLGRDLRTLTACREKDGAYFCNLEFVHSWIQKLGLPNQELEARLGQTAPLSRTTMTDTLPAIRRMLDEDPAKRPLARGLWEKFTGVSLEVCADCDPRHPDVWRSHNVVNSDVTPPRTSGNVINAEPALPSDNNGIVGRGAMSVLTHHSTRLVNLTRDYNKDYVRDRTSDSSLEPNDVVFWPKSFGMTRESHPIKSFNHAQTNDSEKPDMPSEPAQNERARRKSFSDIDFQYGKHLLRENAGGPANDAFPLRNLSVEKLPISNSTIWGSDSVDEDREDDVSDIMSVPSLYSGSSLSSAGSNEDLDIAAEELASLLLKDEIMEPLYDKALEKVKTERFERNFARLLNAFAVDLRVEANTVLELSAVQFVRVRAKHVASCMGKQLDPLRDMAVKTLHKRILESAAREETLEVYLQRRILATDVAETAGIHEVESQYIKEPDLESDSEGSENEAAQQPRFKNLEEVKTFILTSFAMTTLRENFRQFVLQGQSKTPKLNPSHESQVGPPVPGSGQDTFIPLEEPDTDSLDSLEDEGDIGIGKGDRNLPLLPRFVLFVVRECKMLAEFLELKEKPLKQGFRRLRWTCVCGSKLYDDFREIAEGALDELQRYLNDSTGGRQCADGSSSSGEQGRGSRELKTPSDRPVGSYQTALTENRAPDEDSKMYSGLRRRGQGRLQTQEETFGTSNSWILPIFQYEHYGTKVKHLPVDLKISDETFFTMVKAKYHEETSRLRRFFAMRGVTKISYVKFIHAPMEPDIHAFDDWPPQKHSPPWIYKGCPAKKKHIPLVGHTYLMHLWQNPSHSDLQTYKSQRHTTIHKFLCLLGFTRSQKTVNKGVNAQGPNENSRRRCTDDDHQRDIEMDAMSNTAAAAIHVAAVHEAQDPRSSYVFLRTPKKLGEKLIADDEDPPEAWGLYFEEGFRVHHFFLVILYIYTLASLAFAVYWCTRYGLVGPSSGSGAFGVSSWMIGLISLVTTVWFKWAD